MKRYDGRAHDELRPVSIELDFTQNPAGSVLIRSGKTMVLCTAMLEKGVPGWLRGAGRGWVTAEYSMLPGATDTRSEREASRGKVSGRTQEIQRLIGRSLRASIDLAALGERSIYVDCDVLQADGGTRTAAITGGWIALAEACKRLVSAGQLAKSPIVDSVAAISVGIVDGACLLDLPYPEDSRAEVDMNVVRTGAGRLIEVQGTAESGTFDRKLLDQMLDLAEKGLGELTELQRRTVAQGAK